jgi:Fur family ferric uptake transcriptional regulator
VRTVQTLFPTQSADVPGHTLASSAGNWKSHPANEIEQRCLVAGLKMTDQRRIIARVLSGEGDHPDVEELYRLAVAIDKRISIATVYRTVRLFEEKGILSRLDFGGGRARYEPSDHGAHYHLIDIDTGEVYEFQDDVLQTLLRQIARRVGFELVSNRLELFGKRSPGRHKQNEPAK